MSSYPLEKKLKDGSTITLREITKDDELKLLNFFKRLPAEDRQYLRFDVTDIDMIRKRMAPDPNNSNWRIVVEQDDKIWADATLATARMGWMRHISELRCIIHPKFQRKGLGAIILGELYQKALSDRAKKVVCEVVPEQKAAIAILENMGFKRELILKRHVKDIRRERYDLYIYVIDVEEMWNRLKDYYQKFHIGFPP